jgi:hypothetical protein
LICMLMAFATSSVGVAQPRKILLRGTVADAFTEVGIPDVKVKLLRADSTLVDSTGVMLFTVSSVYETAFYAFSVPASPCRYIICAEHPNYRKAYLPFTVKKVGRNTALEVPVLLMQRKKRRNEVTMDAVVVTATKIKVFCKGDTLIFNADAFNVPSGSMLDGLIRQLPGAELKPNGEIFVNGEKVESLTLNGKDFFNGNNKIMLENLPYYMVQNIKVYKKETERARLLGLKNEKKVFTMDVILKRQYRQGYIANAETGGGTKDAYLGRLFGLRFTDHSRLTLIGNLNNLNTEYQPWGDGSWDDSRDFARNGRTTRKSIDAGLKTDTKRWENNVEVNTGWTKTCNRQWDYTETPVPQDTTLRSNTHERRESHSYRANIVNNFQLKMPFMLQSSTTANYGENSGHAERQYESRVNSQTYRGHDSGHDITLGQTLQTSHKLAWGDVLDLSLNANYTKASSHRRQDRTTRYLLTDSASMSRYTINAPSSTYSYVAGAAYSIINPKGGTFKVMLHYAQNWRNEDETFFDEDFGQVDEANSHHLVQMQRTGYGALQYVSNTYRDDGSTTFSLTLPLSRDNRRTHYRQSTLDTCLWQKKLRFEPQLQWDYEKKGRDFSFSTAFQESMAEASDLVALPNTAERLRVYVGNKHLKDMSDWNATLTFFDNSRIGESRQIMSRVTWHQHFNQIVQSYSYDTRSGVLTFKPDNINGNWDGNASLRYANKIKRWKGVYYSSETSVAASHTTDLSGLSGSAASARRSIDSREAEENADLAYESKGNRIDLSGGVNWNKISSNSSNFEQVNALRYSFGIAANIKLPWKVSLSSNFTMERRQGYTNRSLNRNNCLWNATLARPFLRSNKLLVRLTAIDILNDYSAVSHTVSATGRTETWQNSLPSYLLLRVSYRFDLNPKKGG